MLGWSQSNKSEIPCGQRTCSNRKYTHKNILEQPPCTHLDSIWIQSGQIICNYYDVMTLEYDLEMISLKIESSDYDKFQFRWLENAVTVIWNAASNSLMFNHLKWNWFRVIPARFANILVLDFQRKFFVIINRKLTRQWCELIFGKIKTFQFLSKLK